MAELPLQMTEIESYCRVFDFDDDREFFFRLMFLLDAEYMKFLADKREQNKPQPQKPGIMGRLFGK